LFTRIITSINDKIKAFSSLSEGTKTMIVVVAGLAAAIGPLIFDRCSSFYCSGISWFCVIVSSHNTYYGISGVASVS
jgi:hypothetical protein